MANSHVDAIRTDDYGYGYDDKGYEGYAPTSPAAGHQRPQEAPPTGANERKPPANKSIPRDVLDRFCTDVNYDLLISKVFYFFFFAAFGSLFPLIGVYFKQLGMNPAQTGMLIGFRPFVELLSGPFWGNLADKWKKWKTILMFSLFCWIAFTLSLAFVQPEAHSCLVHNKTNIFVEKPYTIDDLTKANMETRRRRDLSGFADGMGRRAGRGTVAEGLRELFGKLFSGGAERQVVKRSAERIRAEDQAVQFLVSAKANSPDSSEGDDDDQNEDEGSEGDNENEKESEADEEVENSKETKTKPEETKGNVPPVKGKGLTHAVGKIAAHIYAKGASSRPEEPKEATIPSAKSKDLAKAVAKIATGVHAKAVAPAPAPAPPPASGPEEEKPPSPPAPIHLYQFNKLPYPKIEKLGLSPLAINHKQIVNLDELSSVNLVSPPMSAVVYRVQDIQSVFLALLVLQVFGEFLSTPAITMADTATLGYLENDVANYGRQRMYGSLGWAVSMFFVGIALDHSNIFPKHPCGTEHIVDRNYMTCYAVFSVLMCCAFLAATQFKFKEVDSAFQTIQLAELKNKVMDKVQKTMKGEDLFGFGKSGAQPEGDPSDPKVRISLDGTPRGDMISDVSEATKPSPFIPRGQPGQAGTLPQCKAVLKLFAPIQYSSMLFILWFMGFGVGIVFAFLFWHLQDLHGTPTLFGLSSVINHLSEIAAFFFIRNIVTRIGHMNVIYAGLVANVVRFMYISFLQNPWWVLPFELLQGLTHAGVWAAGCSYLTQIIPLANRPTAQMILQSLHHAVGRGCGAIIGGALINSYGTVAVFRGYGITCIFVAVGFFALNFFYIAKLPPSQTAGPPGGDLAVETAYLAPHGVPGGMPHSLSSSRIEKGADAQYGSSGNPPTNGYLEPAGGYSQQYAGDAQNIYRGPSGGNQDYGYGYSFEPKTGEKLELRLPTRADSQGKRAANDDDGLNFRNRDMIFPRVKPSAESCSQRLVMSSAPKAPIEINLAQPITRDISYEDASDHGWLY